MKITDTWISVQILISEIYKLRPWSFLEETDVFGIHSPLSDKTYFISIMGSSGVINAIAAYEGTKALGQFWDLEESGTPNSGEILTIPHIILTFATIEYVDPDQLKLIRSMKRDFGYTDEWPEIKYIRSCQFPRDPDDAQLQDIAIILEQTLHVCRRAKSNPDIIYPDDVHADAYLVREATRELKGWKDKYGIIEIPSLAIQKKWSRKDIDELLSLPASAAVLQAHFQVLPLKVRGEGDTVYFPFTVIMIHKKSGYIEGNELLIPEPDYEAMLSKIPGIILNFVKSLGFRPRSIEVKNQLLFEMLSDPFKLSSIKLVFKENLGAAEEAIDNLIESVSKEKK